jgi:uncharacterized protein (UPF0332 family)
MSEVRVLLEKAEESLSAAELLQKNGYVGIAASRVYYACFYTAKALLLSQGLEFSRHGQVIAQYGFHFSRTRLLDPAFHHLLTRTFDLRHIGDYGTARTVDPDVVEELKAEGKEFLAAATRYLDEHPEIAESAGRDDG